MNVRITFDVHADTLANARAKAELVLAGFIGDDDSADNWQITMFCTPSADTTTASGTVILVDWLAEVEAVRGGRWGP
jgi:hypothetical protein